MLSKAEQANRRVGRMEALISDLGQLEQGYRPTELEIAKARELQRALENILAAPEAPPHPDPLPQGGEGNEAAKPAAKGKGKK